MELHAEINTNGILVISLKGRMDIKGAMEIDLPFTARVRGQRAVIVDMSGVNFLASMGLRTIIMGAKSVKAAGGKMVLMGPDANVLEVLTASGTTTVIPVVSTLAEAEATVLP